MNKHKEPNGLVALVWCLALFMAFIASGPRSIAGAIMVVGIDFVYEYKRRNPLQ